MLEEAKSYRGNCASCCDVLKISLPVLQPVVKIVVVQLRATSPAHEMLADCHIARRNCALAHTSITRQDHDARWMDHSRRILDSLLADFLIGFRYEDPIEPP